jgi:hypothetical protein
VENLLLTLKERIIGEVTAFLEISPQFSVFNNFVQYLAILHCLSTYKGNLPNSQYTILFTVLFLTFNTRLRKYKLTFSIGERIIEIERKNYW